MAGRGGKRGKNNILYVKPDDPSFLKQMKLDAGFKEGDTIETKARKVLKAQQILIFNFYLCI